MLGEFNEGRSKSYYCIAATVMDGEELKSAIEEASVKSGSLGIKEKSKLMHTILDTIALKKRYNLALRR
jgi:hypothetical protein